MKSAIGAAIVLPSLALTAMHSKGQAGTRQALLYLLAGYSLGRTGNPLSRVLDDNAPADFDSLTGKILTRRATQPERSVGAVLADVWPSLIRP